MIATAATQAHTTPSRSALVASMVGVVMAPVYAQVSGMTAPLTGS